jgi:hypothetical protein
MVERVVVLALAMGAVGCGNSATSPVADGSAGANADAASNEGAPREADAASNEGAPREGDAPASDAPVSRDDGPDGTSNDAASDAAFVPTPPTGDAGANASPFCADVVAFAMRCDSAACAQAIASECPGTLAPLVSEAYAQAAHQCEATDRCSDKLSPDTACMVPKLNAAPPTPAQRTLAEDFCQACARAPSTLDRGLWCLGHALLPGSTGRMLSTSLLELSDQNAAQVYSAGCIAMGTQAYPNDYNNCENVFLNCVAHTFPPDPAACAGDL